MTQTARVLSIQTGRVRPLMVGERKLMSAIGKTPVAGAALATLLLYPLLRPSVLVGTDLTQAVPMLIAGAIAHAGFGDISIAVVVSLLIGQIPGITRIETSVILSTKLDRR